MSAEQLAAAVERTPAHAAAECELSQLRKRRKELREKLARFADIAGVTKEELRIDAEERGVEREIAKAAHELHPMRQAYGRRVEQAMQPDTQAAAAAALAAIAEAEAAIGRLNELRDQLRLVGRPTPTLSTKPLLITRLQVEDVVRKGEAA